MNDPLSPLERRVYHYLIDYLAEHTYQPSVRDIARRFRIKSTKSVAEIIEALAEKGYIERPEGRSRGVKLIGYSSIGRTQPVPVYERIARTEPYLADEHRSRHVTMDRDLLPSDDTFYLRVPDDSMQGHGIVHNDLVLLDPSARAKDGDVVAVRMPGDQNLTLRVLKHRGASLVLSGGADGRSVTLGPRDDFTVLGVASGVLRAFVFDQLDNASDE